MAVERDYRDDDPLADIIAEVYADGLNDGQSWSSHSSSLENRDYAKARADRLEAHVADLERRLNLVIEAAVEIEAKRQEEQRGSRG